VEWFKDRLLTHCFNDEERGLFVDQLWLNFIPLYFPESQAISDEGANVAYWNVHDRHLERTRLETPRYRANSSPLLFVHFSFWNEKAPEDWSYGRPLEDEEQRSIMAEIGRAYAKRLSDCGLETCRTWPYTFGKFDDGTEITPAMRRHYYKSLSEGAAPAGSPFAMGHWFRNEELRNIVHKARRFAKRVVGM
jgi:hypothetical protein